VAGALRQALPARREKATAPRFDRTSIRSGNMAEGSAQKHHETKIHPQSPMREYSPRPDDSNQ
jgi:hypothetical protein